MSKLGGPARLVGVLALQGAFEAHQRALTTAGATTRQVRQPGDLAGLDALVMPGGESTTMSRLLTTSGLYDEIKPDLGAIADPLIELSGRFLRERGNFLPHAAVLTQAGKVTLVEAMCNTSNGVADPDYIKPMLRYKSGFEYLCVEA